MDKRSTRILIGCVLCTALVSCLFLIVLHSTRLSCELVSIEPAQLAAAQAAAFHATKHPHKPIRSHDETILMKISAYLEYNIQPETHSGGAPPTHYQEPAMKGAGSVSAADQTSGGHIQRMPTPAAVERTPVANVPNLTTASSTAGHNLASNNLNTSGAIIQVGVAASQQQAVSPLSTMPQPPTLKQQPLVGKSNNQSSTQSGVTSGVAHNNRPSSTGPAPSTPQLGFPAAASSNNNATEQLNAAQQPVRSSFGKQVNNNPAAPPQPVVASGKPARRFLPLELRSIETRDLAEGSKHKYVLNFNCTKLNMVLVHQANRVFVESMSLELRPHSNQEATCDVLLPPGSNFLVFDSTTASSPVASPVAPVGPRLATNGTTSGVGVGPGAGVGPPNQQTVSTTNAQVKAGKDYPHLAHYYCNKPMRFGCYHYNPKSGPNQSNGLLLAELHIRGIEFETSTSWEQGRHKKVKSEFKSKRSECLG